jgi:hypothetical protein
VTDETFWGAVDEDGVEHAMACHKSICGQITIGQPKKQFHKTGFCCEGCMNTIMKGGGPNHPLLEYPKKVGAFQRWQSMLEARMRQQTDQFNCKGCADIVGDAEKKS